MLSNRKWTLRPVDWIPLLRQEYHCGYCDLCGTYMFKRFHIGCLFHMPYNFSGNAVSNGSPCGHFRFRFKWYVLIIWLYVYSLLPVFLNVILHNWHLSCLVSMRLNFSVFCECFWSVFCLIYHICLISIVDEWVVYSGRSLPVQNLHCTTDIHPQECKSRCRLEPNCHAFDYQISTSECCLKQFSWGENGFFDALQSDGDMVHYSQHCPLGNDHT